MKETAANGPGAGGCRHPAISGINSQADGALKMQRSKAELRDIWHSQYLPDDCAGMTPGLLPAKINVHIRMDGGGKWTY